MHLEGHGASGGAEDSMLPQAQTGSGSGTRMEQSTPRNAVGVQIRHIGSQQPSSPAAAWYVFLFHNIFALCAKML